MVIPIDQDIVRVDIVVRVRQVGSIHALRTYLQNAKKDTFHYMYRFGYILCGNFGTDR